MQNKKCAKAHFFYVIKMNYIYKTLADNRKMNYNTRDNDY